MEHLKVPRELAQRYLNEGFSGGEKKRVEILQMAMLKPGSRFWTRPTRASTSTRCGSWPRASTRSSAPTWRASDHPLPADPQLRQAGPRARDRGGRIIASGGAELPRGSRQRATRRHARRSSRRRRRVQMSQSETELVRDIGRVGYGWHLEKLGSARRQGPDAEIVEEISDHKASRSGCGSSATSSLDYFYSSADATWGGNLAEIDFNDIYYYLKPTEKQVDLGRPAGRDPRTWDKLGIPQAEKKYLAGVGRSTSRRSSTTSCRPTSAKGVIFLDMDSALREHQEIVKQYFGDDHPAERQQVCGAQLGGLVGRVVHLRATGRLDRDAAPGLLPHQRGEHGPVRADADHRRRGRVRALRRGLHRADLLVRLAALRGRRDRRQEARPLPLHDDPELVEQRLQPRHQARGRLRGRDDGMGRRKPRLEADDEVPGDLADGQRAHGEVLSIAFAGKGQHQDAGGKVVHVAKNTTSRDHLEVDLEERRPRRLPRPARGREGRKRLEVEGGLRRADPRRGLALGHVPLHRREGERRRPRPRGDRLQDR